MKVPGGAQTGSSYQLCELFFAVAQIPRIRPTTQQQNAWPMLAATVAYTVIGLFLLLGD